MRVEAKPLVSGTATGVVRAIAPLSFWGGFDPLSGRVTDRSHPSHGLLLSGAVLVMRAGRGSSSSSSVLAEAIRLGTAPCGIVLAQPDPVIAVGALVAARLYKVFCPVVLVDPDSHARLASGVSLQIDASGDRGWVTVGPQPSTKKKPSARSP